MMKPALVLVAIGMLSCHQNDTISPRKDEYACGEVIAFRLRNIKAIPIEYAKAFNAYYIKLYPDTSQSQTVSVFCDLPDAYKTTHKLISFDGSFSPLNRKDSTGTDSQLRQYFSPAQVVHVAIDKIN